jgi:hypothetical protein
MLASSARVSLTGRFEGSEYGRSKLAGEELFFQFHGLEGIGLSLSESVWEMVQTEL